jgi:Tautomerase enzyme
MPLVQVKVIEGVFSDAQKKAMVEKLTDAMVSLGGESMRQVTRVTNRRRQKRSVGNRRQNTHDRSCQNTGSGEVTLRPTRTTEIISVVRVGFLFVG